jgi:Mg-chelatase subunit ChlD
MKAVGSRVARMSLVGCCAALASAVPLGAVLFFVRNATAVAVLFGLLLGGLLAAFFTVFERLWYGRKGAVLWEALGSGAVGACGGAVGAAAGQAVFHSWGARIVDSASSGISLPLSLGASLGWGLSGLAVGLAITLPFAAQRSGWFPASLGGFVGGLAGGLIMQFFRPLFGSGSLVLGLIVLGGITGFGITWTQRALSMLRLQILEGPGRGSEFVLGRDALIGSESHCPVRLTGAGVAPGHARVTMIKGKPYIRDLGAQGGLTLNDRQVADSMLPLAHGDLIRIGEHLLRVNTPGISGQKTLVTSIIILGLIGPAPSLADARAGDWKITQVDPSRYPLVDLYANVPREAGPGDIRKISIREGDREAAVVEIRDLARGTRDIPMNLSLVVDVSESMEGEKLAQAARAFNRFAQSVPPDTVVNLVSFNDEVRVLAAGISPESVAEHSGRLEASGHTALFDAVVKGIGLLEGAGGRKAVLTLTDGMANRGRFSMEQAVAAAREAGVSLLFVGLGPDSRRNRLAAMAEHTGGKAVYTVDHHVLAGLFEEIAGEISSEVLFRYRSTAGTRQVVPVSLELATRASKVTLSGRYFSPRATFFGTSGEGSPALLLFGLLGPLGLLAAGRLTSYELSRKNVLLVEGSSDATRMLTRVLTRHGMTVPMAIGGKTLRVNNQPVTGSRTLRPGETLTWGETTILVKEK